MRYFPEEIEVDLLAQGIDIAHWWNRTVDEGGHPKLSSRRLLAILQHLPDESAFKTACRDGDWSEAQYIQVGQLNELRIMRSDNAVLAGADPPEPMLVKSPPQLEADQFDAEQKQAIREGIMAQLHAKIE